MWHGLSKTLAEKTAWALAMDRGVNMVSVNAALMMGGPDVSITHPYLKGAAEMYEDGVLLTVDLNFLVDAHICVFENISSYGRYLCFDNVVNHHEDALKLAQMLTTPSAAPTLTQRFVMAFIPCSSLAGHCHSIYSEIELEKTKQILF